MSCNDDLTLADLENTDQNSSMSLFAGGTGSNVNLYSQIHKDQVTGVNLSEESVAKDIIKPWNERNSSTFIESNVDDQLIIYVPFITAVKLKSLLISTESGELRPDAVKIYTNLANCPDFGEVENSQALQEISLERHSSIDNENPHSDHVVEYPLRVARFTNVFSCVLFFPSSVGRSVSRIYYVGFKGECLTPKRENSDRLQIPASNVGDAPVDQIKQQSANTAKTNYTM